MSSTSINTTTLTAASRRSKIVTEAVISAYIHDITHQQSSPEPAKIDRSCARSRRGIAHARSRKARTPRSRGSVRRAAQPQTLTAR